MSGFGQKPGAPGISINTNLGGFGAPAAGGGAFGALPSFGTTASTGFGSVPASGQAPSTGGFGAPATGFGMSGGFGAAGVGQHAQAAHAQPVSLNALLSSLPANIQQDFIKIE